MYLTSGNELVDQIGEINFSGNVIPETWYRNILRDNGKPNLNAIIILADIVYWYRPEVIRDENTGQIIGMKKKFKEDALQRSYAQISAKFGISEREAKLPVGDYVLVEEVAPDKPDTPDSPDTPILGIKDHSTAAGIALLGLATASLAGAAVLARKKETDKE